MFINITQFGVIQDKAEDVVYSFRKAFDFPSQPPIPVEMIARELLGLRIVTRRLGKFGGNTLGALSVEEKIIYVDVRSNWHQRLFTIAHEIGHWVLHRNNKLEHNIPITGVSDLDWSLSSSRTNKKSSKEKLWELEANRFAEALLIPREFLYTGCRSFEVIDANAVYKLKGIFDVSISAMFYRIKNLYEHLEWMGPQIDWASLSQLDLTSSSFKEPGGRQLHTQTESKKFSSRYGKRTKVSNLNEMRFSFSGNSNENKQEWGKIVGDYLNKRKKGFKKVGINSPLVIEFAGTPNAGKDTLIEIVKDYLIDGFVYKVRVFDEGIKSCHIDKDMDVDRLYKTIALSVIQLYDAKYENPGGYDFIIINRSIFDRLGFLHSLHAAGHLSDEQERTHRNYLLSYAGLQDMTFLILISPEESLKRELRSKKAIVSKLIKELPEELDGRVSKAKIHTTSALRQLNASYLQIYWTHKHNFNNQVFLIDHSDGEATNIIEEARLLIDVIAPTHDNQLAFPELFGSFYDKKLGSDNYQLQLKRQAFFHTQDFTQLDLPLK